MIAEPDIAAATPAYAERTQLRDEAAAYIRELVISGQAAPGALLRLGPLAEQLSASVTPIREALLLLAQDGWVIQEPNRGFRVASISRDDVRDTYLVQAFCAGELAARASLRSTPEAIARLRELDAEIADYVPTRHDQQRLDNLNYHLHNEIYRLAEAPRLVWFTAAASRFVPRRFWAIIPGWIDHNRTGHRPIIDAVEKGDGDRARTEISTHIAKAGEILIAYLDSIAFWSEEKNL